MTRKLITSAILSLAAVTSVAAADVSFSGTVDADMAADVVDGKTVFQSNHEIDLTTNVKFTDKVSLQLYTTMAVGRVPYGAGAVENRFSPMLFDGVALTILNDNGSSLIVGDLVLTEARPSYYYYKRLSSAFSSPEYYSRGVQFDMAGFTVAAGASDMPTGMVDTDGDGIPDDTESKGLNTYLAYTFEKEGLKVKPFFNGLTDQSDISYDVGVSTNVAMGDHSVKGTVAYLADPDMDGTTTILVEPFLGFGAFSLAATAYYAVLGDNATPSPLGEEAFYYVEPGYTISDMFAAGLPLEYHTNAKDVDDETIWVVPTFYVYPTTDVQWWIWGGVVIDAADQGNDPAYSFGSEIIASF
jgi:hypothetical protein